MLFKSQLFLSISQNRGTQKVTDNHSTIVSLSNPPLLPLHHQPHVGQSSVPKREVTQEGELKCYEILIMLHAVVCCNFYCMFPWDFNELSLEGRLLDTNVHDCKIATKCFTSWTMAKNAQIFNLYVATLYLNPVSHFYFIFFFRDRLKKNPNSPPPKKKEKLARMNTNQECQATKKNRLKTNKDGLSEVGLSFYQSDHVWL